MPIKTATTKVELRLREPCRSAWRMILADLGLVESQVSPDLVILHSDFEQELPEGLPRLWVLSAKLQQPPSLGSVFEDFILISAEVPEQKLRLQSLLHRIEVVRRSHEQQRCLMQQFKRFVPPQLIESASLGVMETRRCSMTIVFADIRNYSRICEQLGSEQTFLFLNAIYGLMNHAIVGQGGFVHQYMGDGMMALFSDDQSEERAICAAIDLKSLLRHYNLLEKPAHIPAVEIGVGINTGDVNMGVLGGDERAVASVIGDAVNVAARLETLTKRFRCGILISEYTFAGAKMELHLSREVDTLVPKGRSASIRVYEIFDADPEYIKERKNTTKPLLASGLLFFKKRNFDKALKVFGEAFQGYKSDGLAFEYLRRCNYYIAHPPSDDNWLAQTEHELMIDWSMRRSAPRFLRKYDVSIHSGLKHPSQQVLLGHTVDVSVCGLRLSLKGFLHIGDSVMVEIQLPTGDAANMIKLAAQVVWIRESEENQASFEAGVMVHSWDPETRDLYRQVCQSQLLGQKQEVLVVDDDPISAMILKKILTQMDCYVTTLHNPNQVEEQLRKGFFDLVFLDFSMPERNAISVLQGMRQHRETMNIPVIVVTADSREETLEACFQAGASDFITKPITRGIVEARFRAVLEIHSNLNQNRQRVVEQATHLRKLYTVAESSSRAKSEFLSMMNHELRTPLNGIMGASTLLRDSDHFNESGPVLDLLDRSTTRLHQTLESIMSFVSVRNVHEASLTEFNLTEEMLELGRSMSLVRDRSGLDFVVDIQLPSGLMVRSDSLRLRQTLRNLLENAFKYTNEGAVTFSIKSTESHEQRMKCYFEINDTGIGFDPSELDRLFSPFIQQDHSLTRKYEGVGMGLSICRENLRLLNSTLQAESIHGIGSRFWFTLDVELVGASSVHEGLEKTIVCTPYIQRRTHPPTVLVVDDNEDNLTIAQRLLEKNGIPCMGVSDGWQALKAMASAEHNFDLIFMDVNMPGIDGLETTRRLREVEAQTHCHTPIVALTALSQEEDCQRCIKSGMDDFLAKPVVKKELLEMVERWTGYFVAR